MVASRAWCWHTGVQGSLLLVVCTLSSISNGLRPFSSEGRSQLPMGVVATLEGELWEQKAGCESGRQAARVKVVLPWGVCAAGVGTL